MTFPSLKSITSHRYIVVGLPVGGSSVPVLPADEIMSCNLDYEPSGPGCGDGEVNVEDLTQVILNWGPCPGCDADVTGDGVVNVMLGDALFDVGDTQGARRKFGEAIELGAKRLCVCDTVGHSTPHGAASVVSFVKSIADEMGADVGIDWMGTKDNQPPPPTW